MLSFLMTSVGRQFDDVGQVNLPYIAWVAAYNTTVLLCYFLLDLAFFPTPLSKSTYAPVSGLKVIRRPNNSHEQDSDSTSTSTRTSPSPSMSLHRAHASGLPSGTMTPVTGPSPMPAPALLEAINRNSLAIFLLVRIRLSHVSRRYANVWGWYCKANVATGIVNLSMQTMYASDGRAMCVLVAYAFSLSAFGWAARGRRVWKL